MVMRRRSERGGCGRNRPREENNGWRVKKRNTGTEFAQRLLAVGVLEATAQHSRGGKNEREGRTRGRGGKQQAAWNFAKPPRRELAQPNDRNATPSADTRPAERNFQKSSSTSTSPTHLVA
jgi:hypothetical protein